MSGKFDIGSDFNVFDEWGNYVGKFSPSGGGFDGCLFAIALIVLWTVGFAIYLLAKMLIKGIKALAGGDVLNAIKYLAIPMLLLTILSLNLMADVSKTKARQKQNEEYVAQRALQAQIEATKIAVAEKELQLEVDALKLVTTKDVNLIRGGDDPWHICDGVGLKGIGGSPSITCDREAYILKFTLVNNSGYIVTTYRRKCLEEKDVVLRQVTEEYFGKDDPIPKGETTLFCFLPQYGFSEPSEFADTYKIIIWIGDYLSDAAGYLYPFKGTVTYR